MRDIHIHLHWFWLLPAALLPGCAQTVNPSFPVTIDEGARDLGRMRRDPQLLPRPVVVIAGMMDPGVESAILARQIEGASIGGQVITVVLMDRFGFAGYRAKVLDAIDHILPADQCGHRPPADVIGFSLGGLAARYAALPLPDGRAPLNIARLFTISSPHRGAVLAERLPPLLAVQRDLRPGSARLAELDDAKPTYPIYAYVRLHDAVVGAQNAAPPGEQAWWVFTPPLNGAHTGAPMDPRILADIVRRLRGEPPFSMDPPSPLPAE